METYRPSDRLDTLTREVLVTSSKDVFHAPTGDGGSLCGMMGGHRREVEHAPLRSQPCAHCYTSEVVEEYDGPPGE